jgi:hypothetical protein
MNRFLNIITAIIGTILVIGGLFKFADLFATTEISLFGQYVKIHNSTSAFYIIVINLCGGGSMLCHAVGTWSFKRNKQIPLGHQVDLVDDTFPAIQPLSKFMIITAIITLLVSLWMLVKTVAILASFESTFMEFLPLFVIVLLLYGSIALFPILLAGKNIILNNKINELLESRRKAEIRAKSQAAKAKR